MMSNIVEIIEYYDSLKNQIDLRLHEYLELNQDVGQNDKEAALSLAEILIQNVNNILETNVAKLKEDKCELCQLKSDCYLIQRTSLPFEGFVALLVITDWFLNANERLFLEYCLDFINYPHI